MKHIVIEVIPHSDQRYDTVGDWITDKTITWLGRNDLLIRVSDTGSDNSNFLIALHEFVEAMLCAEYGITQQQVDDFDMGPGKNMVEPGDSVDAPYHEEHKIAEVVER